MGGIVALTNLQVLDLSDDALTDIRELSGLAQLTHLDLSGNRIVDLSPLSALGVRLELDLGGNAIADRARCRSRRGARTLRGWPC
ncbi:MAG: leucine-rich repeat domain-containing protein [Candidatus Latescibacterota bacterium]